MAWKKWLILTMLLGLLFTWQQWPGKSLRVLFCDVGQGDAALITMGQIQVLIDTGPSIDKLFRCINRRIPFWDKNIEAVIISHKQKDHNGSLADLEKYYSIGKVIDVGVAGDILRIGNMYFDILSPSSTEEGTENDDSLVVRFHYDDFSILFTGDIDEKVELALVNSGLLKQSYVLKVAHHGSKYGSTDMFLELIKPKLAVVSVGAKNNYGHPNNDTLIRLDGVGATVLRTDKNGVVEVVFKEGVKKVFSDR